MAALKKVDFVVSHEIFMTPTARWSDVIFPAATALEQEDIGIPWQGHYLLYKPQITLPLGEARSDYDALCDLATEWALDRNFQGAAALAEWIEHFIAESEIPDAAEFRRTGIYKPPDPERTGFGGLCRRPCPFPP